MSIVPALHTENDVAKVAESVLPVSMRLRAVTANAPPTVNVLAAATVTVPETPQALLAVTVNGPAEVVSDALKVTSLTAVTVVMEGALDDDAPPLKVTAVPLKITALIPPLPTLSESTATSAADEAPKVTVALV
jgi:hypothetical protein